MQQTESWLARDLAEDDPLAIPARTIALARGAKRARPRLLFQMASLVTLSDGVLTHVAAAIEAMHTASLLHDDVVDQGDLRRGLPTANATHGNAVAVLAGDRLLARALLRLHEHAPIVARQATETVLTMSRAALLEIRLRGRTDVTLEQWHQVAEGKTAILFALCGHAVGLLSEQPSLGKRLAEIGMHLGYAFQLQDDLGDLVDAEQGRCRDLIEKNVSHPVIATASLDPSFRQALEVLWKSETVDHRAAEVLGNRVLRGDGIELSRRAANEHIERALELSSTLGPSAEFAAAMEWAKTLSQRPVLGQVQVQTEVA